IKNDAIRSNDFFIYVYLPVIVIFVSVPVMLARSFFEVLKKAVSSIRSFKDSSLPYKRTFMI
ncbi:MAG TPA: hypothetical protein VL943_13885, partial [Niabella sp.]|nr:hypothetical protein [Niabella sp.]